MNERHDKQGTNILNATSTVSQRVLVMFSPPGDQRPATDPASQRSLQPSTPLQYAYNVARTCVRMHILAVSLALFVLPLAAPACPSGWKASASPADAASEPRCFLVPPERSTSLRGCVARCARHGGAPACLASQEETDLVTGEVPALH